MTVGQIGTSILETVGDIIKSPPKEDKYEALKKRLFDHFAESKQHSEIQNRHICYGK